MPERRTVSMLLVHLGSPSDNQALADLAAALPDADVGDPDDVGVFDITAEADDEEHALRRVWDAIAESGSDDHIVFLEHPDLPEHWRHLSRRPGV
jgi:hypothetical protein